MFFSATATKSVIFFAGHSPGLTAGRFREWNMGK
jgi:hypothetical protein